MIPNPYEQKRKRSPGEIEQDRGNLLLMAFRFLKIPILSPADGEAVQRVGVLVQRWLRSEHRWLANMLDKLIKKHLP